MDREVLDRWCERGILGLTLAVLVFAPLATGAVRTVDFLVVQGLTLGVMALWGARLWFSPRSQLLWPPTCWAVLAFVAYTLIRYATADIELVGREELMRVLVYAFLFLAIVNNLHRQEHTHFIVFTLIFLGMAESLYALFQFLANSNRVWYFVTPYTHRGTGTYINPNNLAGFLEMALPLGLAYLMAGRVKPLTRVLIGYASLMILAGLGVTLSRGGLIATAAALLIFFALLVPKRTFRTQALALLILLAAGAGYLVPKSYFFLQRIGQSGVEQQVAGDARTVIWEATIRMWRDHLWWGVGPGHFDSCFRPYRPAQVQLRPDFAHNEYLNTLADYGVAGTVIVGAVLALLWVGVFKTWSHVRRTERDFGNKLTNKFAFVLGASLSLVAVMIHSCVDFNLHVPANALLAVTLMALLSGHVRFATERFWLTTRPWQKYALSLALLAGVAAFGAQLWRRGREQFWLARDARLEAVSHAPLGAPPRLAALEKAFAAEPKNFDTSYRIGEAYRAQCWQAFDAGYDVYAEKARQAMAWYARGMKLNPWDANNALRYGMCLDRLERHQEAEPYYRRANALDPCGYFVTANIGWHYLQIGDYAAARPWFERSIRLQWKDNPIAFTDLDLVLRRMKEAAAPPRPGVKSGSP